MLFATIIQVLFLQNSIQKPEKLISMINKHKNIKRLATYLTFLCITFLAVNIFAQKPQNSVKSKKSVKSVVKKTASVTPVNPATEDLASKVKRIAAEEGVNLRLFQSLISQESNGRMNAVSYKGAACMTQLMPATARRLGLVVNSSVDERYNPDKCLRAGARYLRYQLDLFKDVRLALAGYNAGEGAVIKFGNRIPPYKETIQYVEKISYRFFGQVGHGTAFAWNLPLAVKYSQAVYGGRVNFASIKQINQSSPVYQPGITEGNLAVRSDDEASVENNQEEEKESVKRTRVELESKPGRVPAASLFFYPKSNQK